MLRTIGIFVVTVTVATSAYSQGLPARVTALENEVKALKAALAGRLVLEEHQLAGPYPRALDFGRDAVAYLIVAPVAQPFPFGAILPGVIAPLVVTPGASDNPQVTVGAITQGASPGYKACTLTFSATARRLEATRSTDMGCEAFAPAFRVFAIRAAL